MFDLKIRLINMLGLLTIIVIAGLVLDYRNVLKKPMRIGMSLAILGITAGIFLTLSAVLPENDVFGRVFSNTETTQRW
jgi:hypothetical protein